MTLLPNTRLSPCPSCAELIHGGASRCPHCGKDMSEGTGMTGTAAALLWGSLTLSGCIIAQPVYGVPDTDSGVGTTSAATESGGESSGSGGESTTTGPTTGMSGTMGTGTDATTTTGPTTSTTGTSGTTDGSGTDGTGTSGTSDQPLYGVVDSQ